jgi:predicted cupin superfamily sugar epimerase
MTKEAGIRCDILQGKKLFCLDVADSNSILFLLAGDQFGSWHRNKAYEKYIIVEL